MVSSVSIVAGLLVAVGFDLAESRGYSDSVAGKRSWLTPTSPKVVVATGQEDGVAWRFRAYLAEGETHGRHTDAICLEWSYPETPQEDFNCIVGLSELQASGGLFGPIAAFSPGGPSAPPKSSFFGIAGGDTQVIQATLDSGDAIPVQLFGPVRELADFKFFVAFSDVSTMRVTFRASKADDTLAWTVHREPPPSS